MAKIGRYLNREGRSFMRLAHVFLADPHETHYGYELSRAARIRPGRLYPILRRMEYMYWIHSDWETVAVGGSWAERRTYELTNKGSYALGQVVQGIDSMDLVFNWTPTRMDRWV